MLYVGEELASTFKNNAASVDWKTYTAAAQAIMLATILENRILSWIDIVFCIIMDLSRAGGWCTVDGE